MQTPYGDSGQTTFFVASADDWDEDADKIVGEQIKVMRRIEPREAAVEGVVTRHGTLVGPVMTELAGFPELTPYGGGWCGNEVGSEFFADHHRELARRYTQQMGDRLRQEGYRGYFELDFLVDAVSGELYLGELNPRVTGASSMTNVTAVAYGDMPLFLFHLLEFMDVDYEIDVDELNTRWAQRAERRRLEPVHPEAGRGGRRADHRGAAVGDLADGRQRRRSRTSGATPTGTRSATSGEAFYLRIADAGGYRYPGADLGILVTRGRFMDDDHELGDRARAWIEGIKGQFRSVPIPDEQRARDPRAGAVRLQDAVGLSRFGEYRSVAVTIPFTFHAFDEPEPGPRWRALFDAAWPVYQHWYLKEGDAARPSYVTARRMLRTHMPELVGTYDRLVDAGRRRRRRGADAVAVPAAAVPGRLLAGRAGGRLRRCWCATTTTRRRGSRASCSPPPGDGTG